MTREEAAKAILTGIQEIGELKKQGYEAAAIGEMGIGNTTISSAICAYLLEVPVEEVTGKGAGLTSQALKNKIQVIKDSLKLHRICLCTKESIHIGCTVIISFLQIIISVPFTSLGMYC